jgi:23S rRNA (adenine2030-N6)-methyltransferase
MNYRHAFHAGNFADIVKHGALLRLLAGAKATGPRLTVLDTHAGAGLYDLQGSEARRSAEAEAGVGALWREAVAPAPLRPLIEAIRDANPEGGLRWYPGSPWLVAEALRPGDRLIACELRPDEQKRLAATLARRHNVQTVLTDGFAAAPARLPAGGEALVLIDPPFERDDDYRRIVETVRAVLRRAAHRRLMIWLPLKDLDTFDRFLGDLETVSPRALVAEARLRPLTDPMKMNGCALVFVNAPAGLEADLSEICAWAAGPAGEARVWSLG